jgi:hypothetical protein
MCGHGCGSSQRKAAQLINHSQYRTKAAQSINHDGQKEEHSTAQSVVDRRSTLNHSINQSISQSIKMGPRGDELVEESFAAGVAALTAVSREATQHALPVWHDRTLPRVHLHLKYGASGVRDDAFATLAEACGAKVVAIGQVWVRPRLEPMIMSTCVHPVCVSNTRASLSFATFGHLRVNALLGVVEWRPVFAEPQRSVGFLSWHVLGSQHSPPLHAAGKPANAVTEAESRQDSQHTLSSSQSSPGPTTPSPHEDAVTQLPLTHSPLAPVRERHAAPSATATHGVESLQISSLPTHRDSRP